MPLVARLRRGVTAASAEPVIDTAFRAHMTMPGIGFGRTWEGQFILRAAVVPAARGADRLRREYEPALGVLAAMVVFVLAIGCVNVASLFLARGAARQQEIALRLAIGAGRWRLVRQLLAEAGLVAVGAGLIGFVAAGWATRYLGTLLRESQRPITIDVQPDARAFAFTLAAAGITTLLFGLAPALRTTQVPPTLRVASSSATGRRPSGRMALVAAQLAMCVVLVFGAALLVRTLRNLEDVDERLAADTVVAFAIDANDTAFPLERIAALCGEAIGRLRRPGVGTGSCSTMTPLDTAREVRTLGLPAAPAGSRDILANAVTPEYFATFGIGATRGRLFTAADNTAAPRVAILNEAAARHFFGDQDPVGRQIAFGSRPDPTQALTVVGVVGDVRYQLRTAPEPMAYQSIAQLADPPDYIVGAVRAQDPASVVTRVRTVVRDLSPELAISWVRTLREQMQAALVTERLLALFSVAFGLLALLLAAVGVYGVIAYDVARRTREIGIRMALGAQRHAVLGGILRQVALIVVPGVGVGLGAGLLASETVEAPLFGITPRDPWTLVGTAVALALVALAAAFMPARRATLVDPAATLRTE
jgi:predicted permease